MKKPFRIGDRIAYCKQYGAVILELLAEGCARLRFDDDSEGEHQITGEGAFPWRRLVPKKRRLP